MQVRVLNKAFLILCLFNAFLWLNPFNFSNNIKDTRFVSQQLVCANHFYAINKESTKSFVFVGLNLGVSTVNSSPNSLSKKVSKFFIANYNLPNFKKYLIIPQTQIPSFVLKHIFSGLSLRGPPQTL